MAWLSGEMDGWAVTVWMEGWLWEEWVGVLKEDDRLTDGCVEVEGVRWTDGCLVLCSVINSTCLGGGWGGKY